ncbi:MAG: single-stranded DNA-binding protein [Elusimicrobia bacterium]|nr:single-stranded DNA-binding protein [Elusimicrobiota bacterium]
MGLKLPEQNQVMLIGRLTHDPELRFTTKQIPVCSFRLALNRRFKDATSGEWREEATFVPIVVWRNAAERCKERLKKGSPVQVEGRLRSREYEDKTGQKRTVLEVEARRVQFLAPTAVTTGAEPGLAADAAADMPVPIGSSSNGQSVDADIEEVPF